MCIACFCVCPDRVCGVVASRCYFNMLFLVLRHVVVSASEPLRPAACTKTGHDTRVDHSAIDPKPFVSGHFLVPGANNTNNNDQ